VLCERLEVRSRKSSCYDTRVPDAVRFGNAGIQRHEQGTASTSKHSTRDRKSK
jgi:hypothetical protein